VIYPGADKSLIDVNYTEGGNSPRLVIVHIMQGSFDGTDAWFRDPASQVSAHFGTRKDGYLRQWVDTDNQAWHAMAANDYSIGIENSGESGEPLTDHQITACARVFRWAHDQYPGIRLWANTRPYSGSGLSWHGLGGLDWGGHPMCPGAPIVHQLPAIIEEAGKL
jgi:hypothetical protein